MGRNPWPSNGDRVSPPPAPPPPVSVPEPLPDFSEPSHSSPDIPGKGETPWGSRVDHRGVGSGGHRFCGPGLRAQPQRARSDRLSGGVAVCHPPGDQQAEVFGPAGSGPGHRDRRSAQGVLGTGYMLSVAFQRAFCALVPLSRLQYTSPSRTVKVKPDKSVTVQLLVYYRVNADGGNVRSVISRCIVPSSLARGRKPSDTQRSPNLLTSPDLQRIWEKCLLQDITAALSRVLPGVTYEQLVENR